MVSYYREKHAYDEIYGRKKPKKRSKSKLKLSDSKKEVDYNESEEENLSIGELIATKFSRK